MKVGEGVGRMGSGQCGLQEIKTPRHLNLVVHTQALCRGEILPFVIAVEQECLFSSLFSIPCALCSASVFILILGLAALGSGHKLSVPGKKCLPL